MRVSKKLTRSLVSVFSAALIFSSVGACSREGIPLEATDVRTVAFALVPSENRIDVFDTSSNTRTTSLKTDDRPTSIAVSPNGRLILATNTNSGTVSVFLRRDNETFQKLNSVGSGIRPVGVVFNPKFDEAYVAYEGDSKILVLDTKNTNASPRIAGTVSLQGASPKKMVVNELGTKVFVTDSANAKLLVLVKSGTSLIRKNSEISLVSNANSGAGSATSTILEGMVITKEDKVYIADYTHDEVKVVDGKQANAVPQSINLRTGGGNIAISSNIGPRNMTVYKSNTTGREKVYVAGYNASIISSIDVQTGKVVNIPLTASTGFQGNSGRDSYNPVGVAVAVGPGGKDVIYVSNNSGLTLSMIDPERDVLIRNTSLETSGGDQDPLGEVVSASSVK